MRVLQREPGWPIANVLALVDLVGDVLFEDGAAGQRKSGEHHVEEHDVVIVEESLSREGAKEGENELVEREQHVLVEELLYHFRQPDVAPTPMHEQQLPQETELRDGVVTGLHGSGALLSEDAYPSKYNKLSIKIKIQQTN